MSTDAPTRCKWAETHLDKPFYVDYHDQEWGVPVHDDRHFFEMLILEGAQAGLSWLTILARRETYRAAYDNFDVQKIANYDDAKQQILLADPRHYSQPRQGCSQHYQCQGLHRHSKRIWQF